MTDERDMPIIDLAAKRVAEARQHGCAAMTEPPRHIIIDKWGSYEVAPDNIMATAPRRRDGWWDRRTRYGRLAVAEYHLKLIARRDRIGRGEEP